MILQPVLPVLLVAAVAVPLVALAVWRLVRERGAGTRMRWAARVVLVLACGALLLRPGIPGGEVATLATDVDVVLLVDTTASIVAEDWDGGAPRLDGVREDALRIVATYPGARFALITFDAEASLRVPLTTDTTALATSLSVLRPEPTANSRGSSIGIAAAQLETTLEAAAAVSPDRARMVFYFGDGEQTASSEPESFAGSASEVAGGAVFGYGTEAGGPMRQTSAGIDGPGDYIQYEGERAVSKLDPQNLERVAQQLGVDYQPRSADRPIELPPAPTTATSADGATESIRDLSWVVALVVVALLAFELASGAALLVRAARVPRRGAAS
ncbi:MAG: VWA domain-containing protein [Protaetiibacter sp.]